MKNIFLNLVIVVVFIMAILPLMAPGCGDEEENVGYHSIDIPGFDETDYLAMLNNPDEEMQYNAICNFARFKDYNEVLTTDSLKGTGEYDTALMVYQKIYPFMESKNAWVSSAAIRFINNFKYNRTGFVQSVLRNNNPSKNVQLEIIMDLLEDSAKDQNLLDQKISFLQRQSSLLLQNGSYLLMGKKDHFSLTRLMDDYNRSNEEYKKLLILDVLTSHITDSVFLFLTNEWAVTRNARIKDMIFWHLPEANNPQRVLQWFNERYDLLEKNMAEIISSISYREVSDIYSRLVVMALEKGWKPSSVRREKNETEYPGEPLLYLYLFENKYETPGSDSIKIKQTAAGKRVEDALLRDPLLKNEWLSFQKRILTKLRPALPPDAIHQHRQLTEEYLRKTRLLLQQYRVDSSSYHSFKEAINKETDLIYKEPKE